MTELFNNIRGLYHFEAPCEELRPYIEFFSESCFQSTERIVNGQPFSIKMFKSWTPTFWINLGPGYNLVLDGKIHHIKANNAIAVTRSATAERINDPADHLFTVKFYPGALKHLIDIDQARINSGIVELHELLPQTFIQKIRSAECFEKRMRIFEEYFLQKLSTSKKKDHYTHLVTQTIASYHEGEYRFNVSELAFKSFTSSRTLTRYFERVIGVSPKQYFEAARARSALTSFLKEKKSFDAGAFGYYDKSHFYRSIASFTGQPLSAHG